MSMNRKMKHLKMYVDVVFSLSVVTVQLQPLLCNLWILLMQMQALQLFFCLLIIGLQKLMIN